MSPKLQVFRISQARGLHDTYLNPDIGEVRQGAL